MGSPIIFNGNAAKLLKPNLIIPAPSGTNAMTIATSAMASNLSLTLPGAVKAGVLYSAANGILSMINPGSGAGTTNLFLDNGGFEVDTSGYSAYFNTPGTAPVTGSGGVPSGTTITRTTTTPLFGSGSGLISKDAVNRQGEGIAYTMGVPLFMRGKQASLAFDYTVDSGTFVTGDIGMYLIDVTNSVVIQPAGFNVVSVTAGTSISQVCNFQIPTTCLSLRVCWHVASTSALAYAIKLDNVILSPQVVSQGSVDTDWKAYTPFIGAPSGNPTRATGYTELATWRRVGDSLELLYTYTQPASTGANNGSGIYNWSLPAGLTMDTAKISVNPGTGNYGVCGVGQCYTNTNGLAVASVYPFTATSFALVLSNASTASPTNGDSASIGFLNFTDVRISFTARVPIVGWSSNNATSDQTANQVVTFQGTKTATQATTANVTDITFTTVKDATGSWNGSQYVVAVPGDYFVSAMLKENSVSTVVYDIYKNGTFLQSITTSVTGNICTGSTLVPSLKAGDIISIRSQATSTVAFPCSLSIMRQAGPNQITAADTVSCGYTSTNLGAIPSSTFTTINYTGKDFDTHNAYNGNTGVWVCPAPGKYQFSAQAFIGGTWTAGNVAQLAITKNGNQVRVGTNRLTSSSTDSQYPVVNAVLNMVAGDQITFQLNGNGTGMTGFASSTLNFMSITRIGAFN